MQKRSKEELNLLTKVELMKLAKSLGLSGFTTFRKDQIIEMIPIRRSFHIRKP